MPQIARRLFIPDSPAGAIGTVLGIGADGQADWGTSVSAIVTKEAPVNVTHPDFGADMTGASFSDAALAAAATFAATAGAAGGAGEMFIPAGLLKLSTGPLVLPSHAPMRIFGEGSGATTIQQTAAAAVFQGASTQTIETIQVKLDGLTLTSAGDGIYLPNGANALRGRDLVINPAAGAAGIHARGFVQQCLFDDVEVSGGAYGYWQDALAGTFAGNGWLFDKNRFTSPYFHGQSINGVFVDCPPGHSGHGTTWIDPIVVFATQHGIVFRGAVGSMVLTNLVTEGNGFVGAPNYLAPQPCATVSGNNTIQFASSFPAALANGTAVTIQQGKNSLEDLQTTVTGYNAGTGVVTLNTAPTNTLAATEFYATQYADVLLTPEVTIGVSPFNITFVNPMLGSESGVNMIAYGLNAWGTDALGVPQQITVIGDSSVRATAGAVRPLYSSGNTMIVGGAGATVAGRLRGAFTSPTAGSPSPYRKLTASGSFTVPAGITQVRVRAIGAGGGGGSAGAATGATLQAGGAGGSGGTVIDEEISVNPGDVLTITIGTGGTGRTGGAAPGGTGLNGNTGNATTVANTTQSTTPITAQGGNGGTGSAGNSTASVAGGAYANGPASMPGGGAASSVRAPQPFMGVVGGCGGGPATATLGGGGGDAMQTTYSMGAAFSVPVASGTAAGTNGTTATQPGCGGAGGGGGAAGTGNGGNSGAGANGQVELWW